MRLLVDVHVGTKAGVGIDTFETTVHAVLRVTVSGMWSDEAVVVDAYIPPHHRRAIFAPLSSWKSVEVLRCSARVSLNRKSLSEFIASGDTEWRFEN